MAPPRSEPPEGVDCSGQQKERKGVNAYGFNLCVSGWRPAFVQGVDLIPQGLSAPPDLDVEQLMTLLAGLLGFGGMRSFEKHRGVASK